MLVVVVMLMVVVMVAALVVQFQYISAVITTFTFVVVLSKNYEAISNPPSSYKCSYVS